MINAITQSACQPGGQLFVAEEIAEDLEQDHQVHEKDEGSDQEPEEVPGFIFPPLRSCLSPFALSPRQWY